MFAIDPTREVSLKTVLQGLGLSDACVAIALNVLQERIDASESLTIGPLPMQIVLPRVS